MVAFPVLTRTMAEASRQPVFGIADYCHRVHVSLFNATFDSDISATPRFQILWRRRRNILVAGPYGVRLCARDNIVRWWLRGTHAVFTTLAFQLGLFAFPCLALTLPTLTNILVG